MVVGRSPSNLYPFMDTDFCRLNLCFISCSSTKGGGNVPALVFTDVFANHFACFTSSCWFIVPSMTGTAQGASVAGRKMQIVKMYTRHRLESDFLSYIISLVTQRLL